MSVLDPLGPVDESGGLLMKQLLAVIDDRTTVICLATAGQIRPVDKPFDTPAGAIDLPPFHIHCRSLSVPWIEGLVSEQRRLANEELVKRPDVQRAAADGRGPYRHPPGGFGPPKPRELWRPRGGGPRPPAGAAKPVPAGPADDVVRAYSRAGLRRPDWVDDDMDDAIKRLFAGPDKPFSTTVIDDAVEAKAVTGTLLPGPTAMRQLDDVETVGRTIIAEARRRAAAAARTLDDDIAKLTPLLQDAQDDIARAIWSLAEDAGPAGRARMAVALRRSSWLESRFGSDIEEFRTLVRLVAASDDAARNHITMAVRNAGFNTQWATGSMERWITRLVEYADDVGSPSSGGAALRGSIADARMLASRLLALEQQRYVEGNYIAPVIREVLDELRPMGRPGQIGYRAGTRKVARETIDESASFYPAEWIDAVNESWGNRLPVHYTSSGRGHFDTLDGIMIDGTPGTIRWEGVARHELGHAVEHANPDVVRAEWAFYGSRTGGSLGPGGMTDAPWTGVAPADPLFPALQPTRRLRDIFPNHGYRAVEETREDEFFHAYAGKVYGRQAQSGSGYAMRSPNTPGVGAPDDFYELLTMGVQYGMGRVPTSAATPDEEFLAWLFGVMATV